jgi:AraC-like DNA-binding protein
VLPRHVAEFIVAAWLVVARQATGRHLVPIEASFRHAAPGDLTEHRRFFGARVRFGGAANGLVLPRRLLDLPLVAAEPGLTAVLERHMRTLAERMPTVESLSARVRQIVAGALPEALGEEAVARRLRISRRTLQRQLAVEGTSFRAVFDALRRDLATRYLHEREIGVAEVAFLLGFSEASAFHRAFRRWCGTTPASFRGSRP